MKGESFSRNSIRFQKGRMNGSIGWIILRRMNESSHISQIFDHGLNAFLEWLIFKNTKQSGVNTDSWYDRNRTATLIYLHIITTFGLFQSYLNLRIFLKIFDGFSDFDVNNFLLDKLITETKADLRSSSSPLLNPAL